MAYKDDQLSEPMVTAEQSMFGTRLPRPTGVRRHVVVVVAISAVAVILAVVLAGQLQKQSGTTTPPPGTAPAQP